MNLWPWLGSITIATGENVFDSEFDIDITQQRLRFPLGLAPAVARQILADKFIAFDSFDGANFDVSGHEIFPKSTKAEPRWVLGYSNHKRQTTRRGHQEYTIGSLTFGQTDEFQLSLTEVGLSGILVG